MPNRIEIDGWSTDLRFSACHLIPKHGKCGHLHGHSYAVHIRVHGRQNEMGFIADFTLIKKMLRELLSELDHRLLLPTRNPDIKIEEEGDNVNLTILGKTYSVPAEDIVMLDLPSATAEDLARYILDRIRPAIVGENVTAIEVGLDEGIGQGAWARWEQ